MLTKFSKDPQTKGLNIKPNGVTLNTVQVSLRSSKL